MRSDRRATRNRVYSLVGAALAIGGMIAGLSTLKFAGERKIAEGLYPYPARTLIALCEAQERFRLRDLDHDGKRDYAGSLPELARAGCITDTLAAGEVRGYRYVLQPDEQLGWTITATPVAPIGSDALAYYVDLTQVVRASVDGPATRASEQFWSPQHGDTWMGPRPGPAGGPIHAPAAPEAEAPAAPGPGGSS